MVARANAFARPARFVELARVQSLGLTIAATIALAASFLADHVGGSAMPWALAIGLLLSRLGSNELVAPGIDQATRGVLRVGVALLGARVTVAEIAGLGAETAMIVVLSVGLILVLSQPAGRLLGFSRSFSLISAAATSICGVMAAMAVASAMPRNPRTERDTVLVCLVVTTLSSIAMFVYPFIVTKMGFDAKQAGTFLGASIHDVAQVAGAGSMVSPEVESIAITTKLLRILLLAPIALLIAVLVSFQTGGAEANGSRSWRSHLHLPWFLVAFVVAVLIHSTQQLPEVVFQACADTSKACLAIAIAALGMKTDLITLRSVSWRPLAFLVLQTIALAGVVMAFILLTPIGS